MGRPFVPDCKAQAQAHTLIIFLSESPSCFLCSCVSHRIDEIHMLVGAGGGGRGKGEGGGGGGLDVANLMKPALARGEFQ